MRRIIILVFVLITFFIIGCDREKIIGGERDEHGCLGPAGYSWDEEIGACIRVWEIESEQFKRAAKIAVEYKGQSYGLTIVGIEERECVGCFIVHMTKGNEQIYVELQNWKASDDELQSECMTDDDCITGGCSGTICQSKDAEPIFTTCEYLPEYACYKEINCGCKEGKCQWDKTAEFDKCVREARESDDEVVV